MSPDEAPAHRCDEQCICPRCGRPLLYWLSGEHHACSDPDCPLAHGVWTWRDHLRLCTSVAKDSTPDPRQRAMAIWQAGEILAARLATPASVIRLSSPL